MKRTSVDDDRDEPKPLLEMLQGLWKSVWVLKTLKIDYHKTQKSPSWVYAKKNCRISSRNFYTYVHSSITQRAT